MRHLLRSLGNTGRAFAAFLVLGVSTVGCAAVVSNLPVIIAAVTDAVMVIDAIKSFVDKYFAARPNPDLEAKVDTAIVKTRSALNLALRTAKGAEKLDQAKVDEAFAEFKVAYIELLTLVSPLGVVSGSSNTLRATPNSLLVPEPMALSLKVK